jgi:hypothetical protein
MLQVDMWTRSVPRAELDQRAREARLQVERLERLLAPRANAAAPWFRRVLCLFSPGEAGGRSRDGRIRGPLSNRRPPMPQIFPRTAHRRQSLLGVAAG